MTKRRQRGTGTKTPKKRWGAAGRVEDAQASPARAGQAPAPTATSAGGPFEGSGTGIATAEVLRRAVALHEAGRLHEAMPLYRRILDMEPDNPDALQAAGTVAFQLGDVDQAVELLRAAIAAKPDLAGAHNNLGLIFEAAGQLDEAEAAYRRTVDIEPGFGGAHNNLGNVLKALGRLDEALAAFRRALEIDPGDPEVHCNLGTLLAAVGRLGDAEAALGRALEIAPGFAGAHCSLGNVLQLLGRLTEAEAAYRRALDIEPGIAMAHNNLGNVLEKLTRRDEAEAAYRRAIGIKPDYAGAYNNLGVTLQELSRLDEAEAAYRQALEIQPDYVGAHCNLSNVLLKRSDPSAALQACDACLAIDPANREAIVFKAIALDELGRRDAARVLVDFDRFIRQVRITPPPGFDGLAAFNGALARHVGAHPARSFERSARLIGTQTQDLLVEPKGPVAALEDIIRGAVEDYLRSLPADPDHPFLANPPGHWQLDAWGIVLEAQGLIASHIHPPAWLSGVYYVEVPDAAGAPGQDRAGWIEFGRPPPEFPCTVEPEVQMFRPEEGLMLLFPSYFYHRAVPFETPERRISISFDVLPVD